VYIAGQREPTRRHLAWVDGSGEIQPLDLPAGEIEEPRLSPDGRRIAFGMRSGTSDIWIHDVHRGTRERVTSDGDNFCAVWTPDGAALTFSSNRLGDAGLFIVRVDGSDEPSLLVRSKFDLVPGSWSPDGSTLLYTEYHPESGAGIWSVRRGHAPEPVLVSRFNEYAPAWSPDGRWFAYAADDGGAPQVYVRRFPAGPRIQISIEEGSEPVWPLFGDALFFRSGDNLMASRITGGSAIEASPPRMVLADAGDRGTVAGLPNYDVGPGGTRILQVRSQPRTTTAAELVVAVPLIGRA